MSPEAAKLSPKKLKLAGQIVQEARLSSEAKLHNFMFLFERPIPTDKFAKDRAKLFGAASG